MSLFYCAIANEKCIVCDCSIANREFSSVVQNLLFRNVADGHLFFSEQGVGVHALKSTGILFVAVTELQASRQQCVQFITDVAVTFASKPVRVEEAKNGSAGCLQHAFGHNLKGMMKKFDEYRGNLQLTVLQANVEGVTNQLRQNVQDLMRRHELASGLVEKSNELESSAQMFQTTSKKVERKEQIRNLKMKFIIIGVVVVVLVLILMLILWQTGVFSSKH